MTKIGKHRERWGSLTEREPKCVTVNFVTRAAISTVPSDQFSNFAFGEPKSTCCRTASESCRKIVDK